VYSCLAAALPESGVAGEDNTLVDSKGKGKPQKKKGEGQKRKSKRKKWNT
jgi:hypothetical protein